MKVMQVNNVYGKGSTGRITKNIHDYLLKRDIKSVVCYGRGEKTKESNVFKTCGELYSKANNLYSRFSGIVYGGCSLSTRSLISRIEKEKPDIVHLQCINGYFVNIFKLVDYLRKKGIKTVVTLHAEFMFTASCSHSLDCIKWQTGCGNCPRLKEATKSYFLDRTHVSWKRMKAAFDGFGNNLIVVSVSPWLQKRVEVSPILGDYQQRTVLNGLDTEIFKQYPASSVKKSLGIKANEKVIFYATPGFNMHPNHIKGGIYVVALANRLMNYNVRFVVAGNYDHSFEYPNNMLMLGHVSNQEKLAQLYSMADITLLTSMRETFSMIVAESLCCGTPVVGFQAGAPEQIAIKEYSSFVEFGDTDKLLNELLFMLKRRYDKTKISDVAKLTYDIKAMCKNYSQIYGELYV